jgi:hypothetical protein
MVKIRLEGFAALDRELAQFPKATGKSILRRTLKSAALPIATTANSLAPVGPTESYSKSFSYSTKLNKRQASLHRKAFKNDKQSVEGFVGTNDPAGVQQEFGNQNHGPQPALRPAWDSQKEQTLDRIGKGLWEEIQKTAARAARKASRLAAKG